MPFPRKPIEAHQRDGTFRKDRHDAEIILVAGRPQLSELQEPSPGLPRDARDFWRDTITRLIDVGVIDRVDRPMLEMLAVQYARIMTARRVIASEGFFTEGSVGQLREHPALRIEREATLTFNRLCQEFALTPVARTRLGLAEIHRRTLSAEMEDALGDVSLSPVA